MITMTDLYTVYCTVVILRSSILYHLLRSINLELEGKR